MPTSAYRLPSEEEMITFTFSWRTPTDQELIRNLVEDAIEYSMLPWWRSKSRVLKRIKESAMSLYYQRKSK